MNQGLTPLPHEYDSCDKSQWTWKGSKEMHESQNGGEYRRRNRSDNCDLGNFLIGYLLFVLLDLLLREIRTAAAAA